METPITDALFASLEDFWHGSPDESDVDSDGLLAGEVLYRFLEIKEPVPQGDGRQALERVLRAACETAKS